MAYNETLADRLRDALTEFEGRFEEKRMFGGLAFLLQGKMCFGIIKDELVVRVLAEKMPSELAKPHVRPMDFTKRPMKEFVYVSGEALQNTEDLRYYLGLGIEHARSKLHC